MFHSAFEPLTKFSFSKKAKGKNALSDFIYEMNVSYFMPDKPISDKFKNYETVFKKANEVNE